MTKFSKATRTDVYNANSLGFISAWSVVILGFTYRQTNYLPPLLLDSD